MTLYNKVFPINKEKTYEKLEVVNQDANGIVCIKQTTALNIPSERVSDTWKQDKFRGFINHVTSVADEYKDEYSEMIMDFDKPIMTYSSDKSFVTLLHFQAKILTREEENYNA